MFTYGSVCSGIEAASVAWEPLGWEPEWFAEIEPFPSAVLAHHWPDVPNLGDMTIIPTVVDMGYMPAPDILVGGTPCQAYSVAGKREGLSDPRGMLTLKFVEIADAIDRQRDTGDECVIVWENVPGVLSSKDNAFGCFLGDLAGEDCELVPPGRKWSNAGCVFGPKRTVAWRILDAQYFGVAQRRRRVFVVASARKDFDPTAVLFEREGVRRDTAPSREAGTVVAGKTRTGFKVGSHWDGCEYAHPTLSQSHNTGGIGASNQELFSQRGAGLVQSMTQYGTEIAGTLTARHDSSPCADRGQNMVVCDQEPTPINLQVITRHESLGRGTGFGLGLPGEAAYTLGAAHMHGVWSGLAVRRLMPVECERLQGFPDGHTQVPYRGKPASDGPRYKALGNSMAVCCMEWIGRRLAAALEENDPAFGLV